MYYLSKKTQKLVAKALVVTSIASMGAGINIINDQPLIAMADTISIGTPEGYNESDYQQLVAFLSQTDSNGITNAKKCGIELNQKGIDSLFMDESEFLSEIQKAQENDPNDGVNNYLNARPIIIWKDTDNVKELYKIYMRGLQLNGDIRFNNCQSLKVLHLGGNFTVKDEFGKSDNYKSISVSNCNNLEELRLANSNLSNLTLDNLAQVKFVDISCNPITSFDFSKLTSIESLNLSKTNLSDIDISNMNSLSNLMYGDSNIKNIKTGESNKAALRWIYANDVNTIDITDLKNLEFYFVSNECEGNLDISKTNITRDKNLRINKLNLASLTTANYSVKANDGRFKYYSFVIGADEYVGSDKYLESTLELQNVSEGKIGKWVLMSRLDGSVKTVYGDTIAVAELNGCDVEVNEVNVSIPEVKDINVIEGTSVKDLSLPKTLDVTIDDSFTTSAAVKWDTGNYKKSPGTYNLNGTVTLLNTTYVSNKFKTSVNVVVDKAPEETKIIRGSVTNTLSVNYGTPVEDLNLPKTIEIILSDKTTTSAAVTWDTRSYNGNVAKEYKLQGEITLPDGITNPNGVKASINVVVKEKPPITATVTSVLKLGDIRVANGTPIQDVSLPKTVVVMLSKDNTPSLAAVSWNVDSYNGNIANTYRLTGTLSLPEGITNPKNLKASINVIVGENKHETTGAAVTLEISGVPEEGETLIANLLDEDGNEFTTDAAVKYKWYRLDNLDSDFNNLIGKNKDYKISKNDIGKYIGVCVKTAKKYFTAVVGKISGTSSDNNTTNDDTAALNTAYNLVKAKLDSITYTNTTTKDNIVSILNSLTLPNGISVSITDSKLVKATYSKEGRFTLNIKLESTNGGSKEFDYVGNISKIKSSSTSSGSGGSGGGSSSGGSSSSGSYSSSNNSLDSGNSNVTIQTELVKDNNGSLDYNKEAGTKAAGWSQNADGKWYYNKEDGTKATGWLQNTDGKWYYLNSDGSMKTGWANVNEKWYYLNSDGSMKTGWANVNGKWYYLNSDGSMKTGWLKNSDGSWYYLNSDGSMAANTTINGYELDKTGKMV